VDFRNELRTRNEFLKLIDWLKLSLLSDKVPQKWEFCHNRLIKSSANGFKK